MSPPRRATPPKESTPPAVVSPPLRKAEAPPKPERKTESPPKPCRKTESPPKSDRKTESPPKPDRKTESPPKSDRKIEFLPKNDRKVEPQPKVDVVPSPPKKMPSKNTDTPDVDVCSPPKGIVSPPAGVLSAVKLNRSDSKAENGSKMFMKDIQIAKEAPVKLEKLSLVEVDKSIEQVDPPPDSAKSETDNESSKSPRGEESNGVGDKIKKFEKAAEDASASANVGRLSRPGSVRGRSRSERLGSDSKDDLPPPATPFKDNIHFDLSTSSQVEKTPSVFERQQSLTKNNANSVAARWQRNDSTSDNERPRPEPQKIIKPEFKPMPSPVDVTIRSPSLGVKIADQFPSHGTAFRNVASPDPARNREKFNEDVNTQNNVKPCKFKSKEKYSVSKGSSYFTRGSEEIWLVKKKDIEEIEERVLDSFRRAGGNVCVRTDAIRPSSDSGQAGAFSHATMGRNKRHAYARSESLDPQWAAARAHTLKRQSSVACTCGHDKKTRAKSAGAETPPRPRSRSHGDENNQGHVLDKYETLV